MSVAVTLLEVFGAGEHGGNPAPIVVDATGLSDAAMQRVARAYGHESGFVLSAPAGSECDFEFRFWVPNHEMEMCGHVTVGAVWLLRHLSRLAGDHVAILTRSGRVDARVIERAGHDADIEISQPVGDVQSLPDERNAARDILSVLGISDVDLAPRPICNVSTSRVKTLVPIANTAVLDGLRPDFGRIEALCGRIGSTGLYPYAVADRDARVFDARQFPRSSGYPEDAATGIAAAALAFGLLDSGLVTTSGGPLRIRQGRAMGRPSEIKVRFRHDARGHIIGCWIGGNVRMVRTEEHR
jgi:PhzF family phenazine biosynthesis protein